MRVLHLILFKNALISTRITLKSVNLYERDEHNYKYLRVL